VALMPWLTKGLAVVFRCHLPLRMLVAAAV
jgi:hypothetical protein